MAARKPRRVRRTRLNSRASCRWKPPDYEKQIAELKAQSESERIDFKLQLAGVRNVKAARALLSDHDNDADKLKDTEAWILEASAEYAKFL